MVHFLDMQEGQSLVEVLVGITIGAILVGSAAFGIASMLNASGNIQRTQVAIGLSQDLSDKVRSITSASWNDLYGLLWKSSSTQYYVTTSTGRISIASGTEVLVLNNLSYTRFFSVEDVFRKTDSGGDICVSPPCGVGYAIDPSLERVTVHTTWQVGPKVSEVVITDYLTRWSNGVSQQKDWSGGGGIDGPFAQSPNVFSSSTNIDASSSGILKIKGF